MVIFGCKKDNIKLNVVGKGVHPNGSYYALLQFIFKGETDDYSVEINTSKSSHGLNFFQSRIIRDDDGNFVKYLNFPSFGNKGVIKWKKDKKHPYIMIGINPKSIVIGQDYGLGVKIYRNGKVIDSKVISFVTALYPFSKDIRRAGYLKKLCISDWKNTESIIKTSFGLSFKYPESKYRTPKLLKELKKDYDDCYVEGSDADKY